jgi:hypothetical protein
MILRWLQKRRAMELAAAEQELAERKAQRDLDEARSIQQRAIQKELGIHAWDDGQAWLRLHQLLKSHEDRITALERRK